MDFNLFIAKAIAYSRRHPEQRIGQAYMNALWWNNEPVYKRHRNSGGIDIWEVDDPAVAAIFHWFDEVRQLWT